MHGIARTRNLKEGTEPRYHNIHRIEVRYTDGRVVCFVPEARREFFSGDDSYQLARVLTTASSTAEWAHVREQY
jgi:hypothetical protein